MAPVPLFPTAQGATTLVSVTSTGKVNSYTAAVSLPGTAGTYHQTTARFGAVDPNLGSPAVGAGRNMAGGPAVGITNARVNGYLAARSSSLSPTVPTTKIDPIRISRSPHVPPWELQAVTGAGHRPTGGRYQPVGASAPGTVGTRERRERWHGESGALDAGLDRSGASGGHFDHERAGHPQRHWHGRPGERVEGE